MFKERLKRIPKTVYLCIHLYNVPYTVRTRKQWKRKTALEQKLIVFDVVTKQIVILVTKMGLFTLHHFYVPCSNDYVKSYLQSKCRRSIPEFNGNFPNSISPSLSQPRRSTPMPVLASALGPQPILAAALGLHCSLRRLRGPDLTLGKLPLGKLHIWEVTTSDIVTWKLPLEKCPLGKYLTPNLICSRS